MALTWNAKQMYGRQNSPKMWHADWKITNSDVECRDANSLIKKPDILK